MIAVRMICKDTLEEKMMKIQESKRELSQDLVKSNASLFTALDKNDLLALVAQGVTLSPSKGVST